MTTFLDRLFGRTSASMPARTAKRKSLAIQRLEERSLMAGITFSNGIVAIGGTDSRDIGSVNVSGDKLQVTLTGPTTQIRNLKLVDVHEIVFRGYGSNDEFHNNTNIRCSVWGGGGDDYLVGGDSGDMLDGGSGSDTIYGRGGIDRLNGSTGDDYLHGGDARDIIHGNQDNDWLWGDGGNDDLYGDAGNDHLYGGTGTDWLSGWTGDDTLDGGNDGSVDTVRGGTGADTFVLENYYSGGSRRRRDRAEDFSSLSKDRITDRG